MTRGASAQQRASTSIVLETDRLRLRRLVPDDAPFIVELLNDPSWLRFIGDKGVRTDEDARDYLRKGPIAMYERYGFGSVPGRAQAGRRRRSACAASSSAKRWTTSISDLLSFPSSG